MKAGIYLYIAFLLQANSCDKLPAPAFLNIKLHPMGRNFTPDATLVDRLLLDDTVAFEELFRRYCVSLYCYCADKLDSAEDAKRITTKIFINIWEKRYSLPLNSSFSLYLYTEVRKAVVQCINEKLCNSNDVHSIEKNILPEFKIDYLRNARRPVRNVFPTRDRTTYTATTSVERSWNDYFDTYILKNVRYAFQKVMHMM